MTEAMNGIPFGLGRSTVTPGALQAGQRAVAAVAGASGG